MKVHIDNVIEHKTAKTRYLITKIVPYNVQVRNIWGNYFTIGKRRLSEFTHIGVIPDHVQRWTWGGEAEYPGI